MTDPYDEYGGAPRTARRIEGQALRSQGEAVAITPHMLNAGTQQINRPTMDADDKKDLAVKVFRAMDAARRSAPTHPAPQEAGDVKVKLKPLEFSNWSSHMQASSILGSYTIKHDGDDPEPWTVRFGSKMIACCNDVEAAKAAAQADFEDRILSTLTEGSSR